MKISDLTVRQRRALHRLAYRQLFPKVKDQYDWPSKEEDIATLGSDVVLGVVEQDEQDH